MLVLSAKSLCKCLQMKETIEATKRAFEAFSAGWVEAPHRTRLGVAPHNGEILFMSAYLEDETSEVLGVKVVSMFPRNIQKGTPTINAAVLVLEPDTGRAVAILDGTILTAMRTGAASGVATDLLSRHDSRVAAIFGAGVQARTQLQAICTVRAIETVWMYDPNSTQVQTFIEDMAGKGPIPKDLQAASSPKQASHEADVICTATTSMTPVFCDADIKEGVHINGVGSYTPKMQEIPADTVARALVVVDSMDAALAEAGDLIEPIQQGIIHREHIHAELGQIVLGTKEGRTDPKQVTLFKSVGLAVQDIVAARLALQNAHALGLGQEVEW